jgi:ABC-type phosphate/phosphonate transport system substrate-binding protein
LTLLSYTALVQFLIPPSLGVAKATARAEIVGPALRATLGREVNIDVARDYDDLEKRALACEAELVWAPAWVCSRLGPSAHCVLQIARNGGTRYRAAIVARKGSRVALSSLRGLRAAWVDPRSMGGYLLPRAHLMDRGVDPDRVFLSQSFVGSFPAVLDALMHDQADVGAVAVPRANEASVREILELYAPSAVHRVEVVSLTEEAPSDALVVTKALAKTDAHAVADALRTKPPPALLGAMRADSLVDARRDAYASIPRLVRMARVRA